VNGQGSSKGGKGVPRPHAGCRILRIRWLKMTPFTPRLLLPIAHQQA